MFLKSLSLRGFRNHDTTHLSFEKGINCFYGGNAQGKTSLLEAISIISTGKSFRSHHLKDLINKAHSHFYLDAHFEKEGHDHRIKFSFDGKEKRIEYNGGEYPNFYPLLGNLPSVCIAPEDIELINGGPQARRRFLDFLIAQFDKRYLYELTRFHKAMRQRNALLKSSSFEAIFAWEKIMVEAAAYLYEKRIETLEELLLLSQQWYASLNHTQEALFLKYQTNAQLKKHQAPYPETLNQLFKENREKEAIVGQTLYGPHRDDVEILLHKERADIFASEGQKRMILIALKFAQWSCLKANLGVSPLLAFDDFGVHLDDERKKWALSTSSCLKQVFITCPSPVQEAAITHFEVILGAVAHPYGCKSLR